VHTDSVTAGRASSHEVQGPSRGKDPSTAHRDHPVDGQPGESPCGSNATRNATTAVHTAPEVIIISVFVLVRGAEAEGFEPPVPLGTLAFKVCEAAYGSSRSACYRWSRLRTTVARTVVNGHE
jgi:hypothetical protein